MFTRIVRSIVSSNLSKRASRLNKRALVLERLEARNVPAILPGQVVQFAEWQDSDGDTVTVRVTGSVDSPTTKGFKIELEGGVNDKADAHSITLTGLNQGNGLDVVVTPNKSLVQPNTPAGGVFATLYTPGYTNVFKLETDDPAMTDLGLIHLSAAIVNKIDFGKHLYESDPQKIRPFALNLAGITLDPGQAPEVDRNNTQNNQQGTDSGMYKPVTGLIHLGGISAGSIGDLVINGAVSAETKNPFDTTTTNDFRSVIEVEGGIGNIIGLRSNMRALVHADRIGTIRVAAISGEITTRDKAANLSINLPSQFSGFINSAGHLNLGFPMGDASKITGQITALGISGVVKDDYRSDRYRDPLYIPGTYMGSITVTGNPASPADMKGYLSHPEAVGNIPEVDVDGIALFGLTSQSGNIGPVNSDGFDETFVAQADGGSVGIQLNDWGVPYSDGSGGLNAGQGAFEGHVRANLDVGNIRATKLVGGSVSAGRNIGTIYSATEGYEGKFEAGGNIGDLLVWDEVEGALKSGGSLGKIQSRFGSIEAIVQAQGSIGDILAAGAITSAILAREGSIGAITCLAGGLESSSIQAGGSIGNLALYLGMEQTSIVAGGDIGTMEVRVGGINLGHIRGGNIGAIHILDGTVYSSSFVAGGNFGGLDAFGSFDGHGLFNVSIVAGGNIGPILGQTHTGDAISALKLEAQGNIASVTGISYGQYGQLTGTGILDSNFAAANIGTIRGRSAGGNGIENSKFVTFTARNGAGEPDRTRGNIGQVTGDGWLDGLLTVTVVAHNDIAGITGTSIMEGNGISGGSYDANYGNIGPVVAAGGAAASYGLYSTRIQATTIPTREQKSLGLTLGRIESVTATANAGGQDAIFETTIHAAEIGKVTAVVHGGVDGNGITRGEVKAFDGKIEGVTVDVRSTKGTGITDGKFSASTDFGPILVTTLNNTGISGGEFKARGGFDSITVEVKKNGAGITGATFEAPGRIYFLDHPEDPRGNIGPITVKTGGKDPLSHAIADSEFTAIGDIGQINAFSMGGTAILNSTFTADSDGNYDPNETPDPNQPQGQQYGNIAGIYAEAAGRNLAESSAIVGSTFQAANIGAIQAKVVTVEGGAGIKDSLFKAQTSIYDGKGNYNDTGTIGAITVSNAGDQIQADVGTGIKKSFFFAGAAGGIGNIRVDTQSGSGILESIFDTSILAGAMDPDQAVLNAKIGTIIVNAGRIPPSTVIPAGITGSSFTSPGGIGDILVNSVGTGITLSNFMGNADLKLFTPTPGNLGKITVNVPGRLASAVTLSHFGGANIGDITIRLTDEAARAGNAVAFSDFTAKLGTIGNVTVIHSDAKFAGILTSYAILDSAWTAATGIGAITLNGNTQGAVFTVAGQPVPVWAMGRSALVTQAAGNIGPVSLSLYGKNSELTLNAQGEIGPVTAANAAPGSGLTLNLFGNSVGDILVDSPGVANVANLTLGGDIGALGAILVDGDLNLSTSHATRAGDIGIGGNATLDAIWLEDLGNLEVGGILGLPQGLPNLLTVTGFQAGGLKPATGKLLVGANGEAGSSIGPIVLESGNTGSGQYQFIFESFTGVPNAVIGGTIIDPVTSRGRVVDGVLLATEVPKELTTSLLAGSPGIGKYALVNIVDTLNGGPTKTFQPYVNYIGGVVTTLGDITGDTSPDLVTAPASGGSHITVWDVSSGSLVTSLYAFAPQYRGQIVLAAGDVDGDGMADVVAAVASVAPPHLVVFSGEALARGQIHVIASMYVYATSFRGGLRIACGDLDGDGRDEVVAASGPGTLQKIVVLQYEETTGGMAQIAGFLPDVANGYQGGLYVACADTDGDLVEEIVTGSGQGTRPLVTIYALTGTTGTKVTSFWAYPDSYPVNPSLANQGIMVAGVWNASTYCEDIVVSPVAGRVSSVSTAGQYKALAAKQGKATQLSSSLPTWWTGTGQLELDASGIPVHEFNLIPNYTGRVNISSLVQ